MSSIHSSTLETRNPDDMIRHSSRSTGNIDAIDCIVNSNEFALENEVVHQDVRPSRRTDQSRRESSSKRPYESSSYRATRHSPPSVTRKRPASPSPATSSSSRSHHHHHTSQRNHRVVSPSPPPPPPLPPPPPMVSTSSRHQRSNRPLIPTKRPRSHSRSPHERRSSTTTSHRSRLTASKEQTDDNYLLMAIATSEEPSVTKKAEKSSSSNADLGNFSLISEDESTKATDNRALRSTPIVETKNDNKFHSTPVSRVKPNDSVLETSVIGQDYDLSLYPNSTLSSTQHLSPSPSTANEFLAAIDLVNKYKTMVSTPSVDPTVQDFQQQIISIIRKRIELDNKELELREREANLRRLELNEREKRFQQQVFETTSPAVASPIIAEPTKIEEKTTTEQKPNVVDNVEMKNIRPEESVMKSIETQLTDNATEEPPMSETARNPSADVTSEISDEESPAVPQSLIKSSGAVSSDPIVLVDEGELKVTSSSFSRKVEIQSGKNDKFNSKKGSIDDLRITLGKNRSKPSSLDETNDEFVGETRTVSTDEQTITVSKVIPSKSYSNKEENPQHSDYQTQRSFTSNDAASGINYEKRDNRRHQQNRSNGNRQYSGQNTPNERSYPSTTKYGSSNPKRYEGDDLRARIDDNKHPKSSRNPNRNNY